MPRDPVALRGIKRRRRGAAEDLLSLAAADLSGSELASSAMSSAKTSPLPTREAAQLFVLEELFALPGIMPGIQ